MRTLLALTFAVGALALTHPARADDCEPAACAAVLHRREGLEATLHVGLGGHLNDTSTAFTNQPRAQDHLFWPGFGSQLTVGYRFVPWLSAGAHVAYQNNPPRDLPPGTTGGMVNTFAAGVYLRAYPGALLGWHRFEPWISVGVDPYAGVWASHSTAFGDATTRIDTTAIPVSIGLDFVLLPHLAVSVLSQVSPWIAWQACSDTPGMASSCTRDNLDSNTYFFFGLGVRAVL